VVNGAFANAGGPDTTSAGLFWLFLTGLLFSLVVGFVRLGIEPVAMVSGECG
jgi:hypothetical protein